ncbi:MAG: IMP dehydrogenase [Planctomycetes bacterium]|nr:IMP dehydrogenase [Planctomycetota bacterium]
MRMMPDDGLTFDDVLLVPGYSEVLPRDADTRARFTRGLELKVPIVSAAMDTVTESAMAIALAREGGIGVIHKNLAVPNQVREVQAVKRSANGVIRDPITLAPDAPVKRAKELMQIYSISGLPIVEHGKVVGILTNRDLRFLSSWEVPVSQLMSRELVTAPPDTTPEQAKILLQKNKVEKLILVDERGALKGLITIKDLDLDERFPSAAKDQWGRLRCAAAVGVLEYERIEALIGAEVDAIVIDTAHGHSKNVLATVREAKKRWDVQIVAGNIATAEAARALIDAGVDAIKVGIGPGSICTTRIVAGIGVPQLTAITSCAEVASAANVPLIADGGIRWSGDIVKALAAGASTVMLGGLLAGLDESPGETFLFQGRSFKAVRGMGSLGAMVQGSKDRYGQGSVVEKEKLVPEGVEGMVPFRGRLSPFVHQLVGGLRAGMGYVGAANLTELREKATFQRITAAGVKESHPHDIQITKESSNYPAGGQ